MVGKYNSNNTNYNPNNTYNGTNIYYYTNPPTNNKNHTHSYPTTFDRSPSRQTFFQPSLQYYQQQQQQLKNSPTPKTPFDPTYGISLIPSHLLINSPYINNNSNANNNNNSSISLTKGYPTVFQNNTNYSPVHVHHRFTNSNLSLVSVSSRINPEINNVTGSSIKLSDPPKKRNKNIKCSDKKVINKNNSIINIDIDDISSYVVKYKIMKNQTFNIKKKKKLKKKSLSAHKKNDVTASNNKKYGQEEDLCTANNHHNRDADAYEFISSSLLFINISPEIELNDFVRLGLKSNSNVIKIFKATSTDSIHGTNNMIVSFPNKDLCSNFYNFLLQRLADFKKSIKSSSLDVKYVKLEEYINNKKFTLPKNLVLSDLKTSRFLLIKLSFDDSHNQKGEEEKNTDSDSHSFDIERVKNCLESQFLSQNLIYTQVDIFNTNHVYNKLIGKTYIVVHFISDLMAIKALKILKKNSTNVAGKINFGKAFLCTFDLTLHHQPPTPRLENMSTFSSNNNGVTTPTRTGFSASVYTSRSSSVYSETHSTVSLAPVTSTSSTISSSSPPTSAPTSASSSSSESCIPYNTSLISLSETDTDTPEAAAAAAASDKDKTDTASSSSATYDGIVSVYPQPSLQNIVFNCFNDHYATLTLLELSDINCKAYIFNNGVSRESISDRAIPSILSSSPSSSTDQYDSRSHDDVNVDMVGIKNSSFISSIDQSNLIIDADSSSSSSSSAELSSTTGSPLYHQLRNLSDANCDNGQCHGIRADDVSLGSISTNVSVLSLPQIQYLNRQHQSKQVGSVLRTPPQSIANIIGVNDSITAFSSPAPGILHNIATASPKPQYLDTFHTTTTVPSSFITNMNANRTIYIGNIHPKSRPEDICNVVRGGILESIKFIREKNICFIRFIDPKAALEFYTTATLDSIILHGNILKIGWGQNSHPLSQKIALAVTVGASRNIYVSLPDIAFKDKYIHDPAYKSYQKKFFLPAQDQLRADFVGVYGGVEQINYLFDGHCCWVNFINICSAIRLIEDMENDPVKFHAQFANRYQGLIIRYGKDRCGNVNRNGRFNPERNYKNTKKIVEPGSNVMASSDDNTDFPADDTFTNGVDKGGDDEGRALGLCITSDSDMVSSSAIKLDIDVNSVDTEHDNNNTSVNDCLVTDISPPSTPLRSVTCDINASNDKGCDNAVKAVQLESYQDKDADEEDGSCSDDDTNGADIVINCKEGAYDNGKTIQNFNKRIMEQRAVYSQSTNNNIQYYNNKQNSLNMQGARQKRLIQSSNIAGSRVMAQYLSHIQCSNNVYTPAALTVDANIKYTLDYNSSTPNNKGHH